MVQSGISLRIVGEILGHQDLSVTQRYAHLSPEHLRESISIIDENVWLVSGEFHGKKQKKEKSKSESVERLNIKNYPEGIQTAVNKLLFDNEIRNPSSL